MTRIVAISDTHNKHSQVVVPECDILIHAGDFSMGGRASEVKSFLDWFSVQPAKHLVLIAGNHDLSFENSPEFKTRILGFYPNINYLEDSAITLEGLKIYGSPFQPEFGNWAFNLPRGKALRDKWAQIPDDTNILVTHGPPMGILDTVSFDGLQVGCLDLLERIDKLSIRLHVFGHIHENHGRVKAKNTIFSNVAIVDDRYRVVNQPMVFSL